MSRISTNLSKLGLVIRGTYGEGSNVIGAMYQLSNQITLGLSEKEAVENLQNITMQLISEERKTRASLSKNINVQDKVGRSAGHHGSRTRQQPFGGTKRHSPRRRGAQSPQSASIIENQ